MKIILTGASGFLGKHIAAYFKAEELITIGRSEGTVIADLGKDIPVLPVADLVIHAAGKAHVVPKSEAEEQDFYAVNVQGTKNLLNALESVAHLPAYFVFISSIAVYGKETGNLINEDAPLAATDPYGKTKIIAEKLITEWCNQHQVKCAILRLPLIAGANPPGNLRSMISGIKKGYYFNIAGGKARKSMVLASSVPAVILPAAAEGGIYNLTDGCHPSFAELSAVIAMQLDKSKPISVPEWLGEIFAFMGNFLGEKSLFNTKKYKKMINDLTFDDSRARRVIAWNPLKVTDDFKIQ